MEAGSMSGTTMSLTSMNTSINTTTSIIPTTTSIPTTTEELSDLIRDNLQSRRQQMIMRTMVKESLMKESLMKDSMMKVDIQRGFDHIFQSNPAAESKQSPGTPTLVETTPQIKSICQWLQQSTEGEAIAFLSDNQTHTLLQILSPKGNLPIVMLTEYPHIDCELMKGAGLSIGVLSGSQSIEEKIKVLERYELGRLNVLMVSTSLWREEDWHQVECEILLVSNIKAVGYTQKELTHIIAKCKPNRVIYLHQSILVNPMQDSKLGLSNCKQITQSNISSNCNSSFVVLKCSPQEKGKVLLNYISKTMKRYAILVRNRSEVPGLMKVLSSAGKTPFNAFQVDRESDMQTRKVYEMVRRCSKEDVIVADVKMDWIKYVKADMAIMYSFADVIQFVEFAGTAIKEKLLLFTEDQYYGIRNALTAELPAGSSFAPLISYIILGDTKGGMNTITQNEDRLLARYSLGKENNERVLRLNYTARKFSCSKSTVLNTVSALATMGILKQQYKTIYQIQIQPQSYNIYKQKFPSYPQTKRRIALLPLSTSMKTTTITILKQLKAASIKFKVLQQAIMLVILSSNIFQNEAIPDYNSVYEMMTANTWRDIAVLDRSADIYRQIGYSSIQLIRREKVLNRKDALLSFQVDPPSFYYQSNGESAHRVNQLITDVEQLLNDAKEEEGMYLDEHQITLILQGVEKGKSSKWKEHSLWGRYRKWKYEELIDVIKRMRGISGKKVKSE